MALPSEEENDSQFDSSSSYDSTTSCMISFLVEADSTISLSGEEGPRTNNESGPANLLLPTASSQKAQDDSGSKPEGAADSYTYWQTAFSGNPDLSSLIPVYDPAQISDWHPEYPSRKYKKSKKMDRPKRMRRVNFLIEERNWIDQKYLCLSRLYPNLRINQIAKMIHDELYVIPLVDIGDSDVRTIRKLIKRFSACGVDRQYESVLFHLYNRRKNK